MGRRSQISGATLSTARKGSVIEARSGGAQTGSPPRVAPNQSNETPDIGYHSTHPDPVISQTLFYQRSDIKYVDTYGSRVSVTMAVLLSPT